MTKLTNQSNSTQDTERALIRELVAVLDDARAEIASLDDDERGSADRLTLLGKIDALKAKAQQ